MRQGIVEVLGCAVLGLLLTQTNGQSVDTEKPQAQQAGGFFSGFNPFAKSTKPQPTQTNKVEISVEEQERQAFQEQMEKSISTIEQAKKDYLRRQAVLDELRMIGIQMRDEALIRRVEELNQRNDAIYNLKRTFVPTAISDMSEESAKDVSLIRTPSNNP